MSLLGFVVFGIALAGFMQANTNPAAGLSTSEMNFPALVLANGMWALLIAIFIDRSGARSFGGGARTGAIAGFLGMTGFDLTMLATTRLHTGGIDFILVDVLAFTVLTTCAGATGGWIMGRMSRRSSVAGE